MEIVPENDKEGSPEPGYGKAFFQSKLLPGAQYEEKEKNSDGQNALKKHGSEHKRILLWSVSQVYHIFRGMPTAE
jgi:hypothetical protein